MKFPIINYKYNGLEEARSLATVMDQKMVTLEKYLKEGSKLVCEVEFEKTANHNNGRVFRVEANLYIDGILNRAEATEESFEKAINEVKSELDKELRRSKDKQHSLFIRAKRRIKEKFTRTN